jgi:hypothetical protein
MSVAELQSRKLGVASQMAFRISFADQQKTKSTLNRKIIENLEHYLYFKKFISSWHGLVLQEFAISWQKILSLVHP